MPTIALVDDDHNVLTSASVALEAEGYRVATYLDGALALDGFRTAPPDLTILDIKMPRMDGMEMLRRLRAVSRKHECLLAAVRAARLRDTTSRAHPTRLIGLSSV